MKKFLAGIISASCLLAAVVPAYCALQPEQAIVSAGAQGSYNYSEALQKSILFYELQRSGDISDDIRTNWRADSCMDDGSDVGLDLTGGWYDAGDNVKFNLPMSFTASMLGWSAIESEDYLKTVGEYDNLVAQIKWATDYFIKCHPTENEYYFQVGDGNLDHSVWAAAEVIQMERPSYKADLSCPGSAVTAETAASLAIAAIIFEDSDPAYSQLCLKHSKELLALAEKMNGDTYYDSIAGSFYKSWSGFYDELTFASAWLYLATDDGSYLDKAEQYAGYWGKEGQTSYTKYKWAISWDDVTYAAALLLAEITGDSYYNEVITRHLDYWTIGTENGDRITYTPQGLAYCDTWGALRYSMNTAFLATLYAESEYCPADRVEAYSSFAKSQVDYALGSTGRSYVCGFGVNPPQSPHHRTASGVWSNNCSGEPAINRHVLVGALVGGPNSDDSYTDERSNYTNNEVACDYNACFTGVLAKMSEKYGGTFCAECNAYEESDGEELYIMSGINYAGQDNFVELKSVVYNHTAWPARVTDNLSFRYFVDISDVIAKGYSASDFTVRTNYNQHGATVTGLLPWDEANGIYYVNIDLSGALIYPGGQSECRSEIQYRIEAPCSWNYKNSPSFAGLAGTSNNELVAATGLALYEGDSLVFGQTPSGEDTVVVNKAPTANSDSASTKQDTAVTINVLANDKDSDGSLDANSIAIATKPANGSVSVAEGKVIYTPASGFYGTDKFTYTVKDNDGAVSDTALVSVTVEKTEAEPEPENAAPAANSDSASTKQDTAVTINVLANDKDSDGSLDANSIAIATEPANGSVSVAEGKVIYTPASGFYGTDKFTYTVKDNDGAVSNTALVSVTVEKTETEPEPENAAPAANSDSASTKQDTAVTVDVLANDKDSDGSLDANSIAIATEPANGSVSIADGKVIYTPASGFYGTDKFTYTVKDNDGAVSEPACVSVAVEKVETEEAATGDIGFSYIVKDWWNAGYNAEITLTNNTDTALTNWYITFDWASKIGDVFTGKLSADGTSYSIGCMSWNSTINPGQSVSIQFQGKDTKQASEMMNIVFHADNFLCNISEGTTEPAENAAPVANSDSASTKQDTAVAIEVLANDKDSDGSLDANSIAIATKPANGSVSVTDGKVIYTPASGFYGTDKFTYTVKDNDGAVSDSATVTVTVEKTENDVPSADGIEIEKIITSEWGSGYNVELVITNNTDGIFSNWYLTFDWASKISAVFTGELSANGGSYTIGCMSWNSTIAPGESVTVYFQGSDALCYEDFENLVFNADGFICQF